MPLESADIAGLMEGRRRVGVWAQRRVGAAAHRCNGPTAHRRIGATAHWPIGATAHPPIGPSAQRRDGNRRMGEARDGVRKNANGCRA
jgi:hypothetical protein